MVIATGAHVDGYATALVSLFGAEGDVSVLGDEFFAAAVALDGEPQLRETLTDDQIPLDRKLAIISDLVGGRGSRIVVSGIHLVMGSGHIRDLHAIASRVTERIAEEQGSAAAEVRSATALDADQVRRLTEALSTATGRRVHVNVVVDPTVLGGAITKIGDTVFDGSVKSKLDELREQWG